jgi:hypothetical protein
LKKIVEKTGVNLQNGSCTITHHFFNPYFFIFIRLRTQMWSHYGKKGLIKAIPILFFIRKVSVNWLYCFYPPNFTALKRYNYFYAISFEFYWLYCFKTFLILKRRIHFLVKNSSNKMGRYNQKISVGFGRLDSRNLTLPTFGSYLVTSNLNLSTVTGRGSHGDEHQEVITVTSIHYNIEEIWHLSSVLITVTIPKW